MGFDVLTPHSEREHPNQAVLVPPDLLLDVLAARSKESNSWACLFDVFLHQPYYSRPLRDEFYFFFGFWKANPHNLCKKNMRFLPHDLMKVSLWRAKPADEALGLQLRLHGDMAESMRGQSKSCCSLPENHGFCMCLHSFGQFLHCSVRFCIVFVGFCSSS